jgi:hypothetical protein
MVVTQEHKTHFVSSTLHRPNDLWEVEHTVMFCHINYVNMNGVSGNGRKKHTLNFYTSKTAVLLVRYGRNGWSQFVGVLIVR